MQFRIFFPSTPVGERCAQEIADSIERRMFQVVPREISLAGSRKI